MPSRNEITDYLNEYLKVDEIKDYGPQGLQVEGKMEIKKVVTGVSASVELFQRAVDVGADMIIVHHGLLWDRDSHVIKGSLKKRIQTLLSKDINLLAYHLPLDVHPEIGNNILTAKGLGLKSIEKLGGIGLRGIIPIQPFRDFLRGVEAFFKSRSLFFEFGPENVEHIGFCSGGAGRDITFAIDYGLHVFITGEVNEATMHLAKEGNIHFIAAGHYATERLGITALGEHIAKKLDVTVEFIDIPNPV